MTRTEALQTVLEFVERYNKQDAEKEVAEAAGVLEAWTEEPVSFVKEDSLSGLNRVYRGMKERV